MSAAPETPAAPQPVPVRGGVVPYLTVDGAVKAAEFYARAFGAQEVARVPLDEQGRTCHLHLYLNGSSIMLSDPFPEHGHAAQTPQSFNLAIMVEDIDAWFQRAVEAGASVIMPVEKMFWGDRYCQLRDPFGVMWAMNEPGTGAPAGT